MIFNANKFGKGNGGDSNNNSISPTRRMTATGNDLSRNGGATPKKSDQAAAVAQSMNSSGKFSVKNAFGAPSEKGGEPLELMQCPSHENQPLEYYSIPIREFMCKTCLKEIEGTQREVDLNPIAVEDAFKVLENRLNMQHLVNLDEKARNLLDLTRKKREFA